VALKCLIGLLTNLNQSSFKVLEVLIHQRLLLPYPKDFKEKVKESSKPPAPYPKKRQKSFVASNQKLLKKNAA